MRKKTANAMKTRNKTQRDIWKHAEIVTAQELGETKIHVTMRLDPKLYRKILLEQKRENERTVTATIERILKASLDDRHVMDYVRVVATIRNLLAHSALQDEILTAIAAAGDADVNIPKLLTERDGLKSQSDMLGELVKTEEQKLTA
jgi:hypothetical protein